VSIAITVSFVPVSRKMSARKSVKLPFQTPTSITTDGRFFVMMSRKASCPLFHLQIERKKRTVIREDIGSVDGLHHFKSFGDHRSLFSVNALTVNRRCGLECQ
jgi:hypothetical protein